MLKIKLQTLRFIVTLVISGIYAFWLFRTPHEILNDRDAYLTYVTSSDLIFQSYLVSGGVLTALFNEPLFLLINYSVYNLSGPYFTPEQILYGYVYFICFNVCLFLLQANKKIYIGIFALMVFLSIPNSYGIQLASLRQSLAMSFILIALIVGLKVHEVKFLSVVFVSGFIHSFFFLFFAILLLDKTIIKIYGDRLHIRLVFIAILSFLASNFTALVGSYLGVRQVGFYETVSHDISGVSFVFWSVILVLIIINSYKYQPSNRLQSNIITITTTGIMFYIVAYWISPISGRIISFYSLFAVYSVFYRINGFTLLTSFIIILFGVLVYLQGGGPGSMLVSYHEFLKIIYL